MLADQRFAANYSNKAEKMFVHPDHLIHQSRHPGIFGLQHYYQMHLQAIVMLIRDPK